MYEVIFLFKGTVQHTILTILLHVELLEIIFYYYFSLLFYYVFCQIVV